jgi:YkoY family integral membrane protein
MVSQLLIICNLFLLEVMLSIDNAAVLAIMVKDLPAKDRPHALKYGILGAFVLRGASLFFVSILVRLFWLKIAGGLYLLFLVYKYFSAKPDFEEVIETKDRKVYRFAAKLGINQLWATVILVELMDMSFSVDNIFASVAMTSNIVLILIGVFIGIIAMRFVAQLFSLFISRYPFLETSAFVVIGLLGLKLIAQCVFPIANSRVFDLSFSGIMLIIFLLPLLWTRKTILHAL